MDARLYAHSQAPASQPIASSETRFPCQTPSRGQDQRDGYFAGSGSWSAVAYHARSFASSSVSSVATPPKDELSGWGGEALLRALARSIQRLTTSRMRDSNWRSRIAGSQNAASARKSAYSKRNAPPPVPRFSIDLVDIARRPLPIGKPGPA